MQSQFPYHVVGRCINKQWFDLPMEEVWEIVSEQLFFSHHAFNLKILSFVLMSNHFHLIAWTPDSNLDEAMAFFMRETSREIIRRAGRINQAWGAPYFRCLLSKNAHYLNAYKYVYRNPIHAGLDDKCERYPFSTLHGLLGFRRLLIPTENDSLLFSPDLNQNHLEWLNAASLDDEFEVQKALRKSVFQFRKPCGRSTRADNFVY